jgi:hypothetical protein
VTIYFIYLRAVTAVKEEIREGLLRNVSAAATIIDGDQHRTFNSKASKNDQAYRNFIQRLERLRQASRDVRYAYTNILKDGKVYFIANGSPQNDNNKDGRPDEAPQLMDPYPDAGQALVEALRLNKTRVDREPYTDIWGTFYSAYAPFKDSKGRFVGTLGMDLELVTLQARLKPIGLAAQRAAFTSGILAVLFGTGVWYFRSRSLILDQRRRLAEDRLGDFQAIRSQERSATAAQLEAVASRLRPELGAEAPTPSPNLNSSTDLGYADALGRYAAARQGIRQHQDSNFSPTELIKGLLAAENPLQVADDVPAQLWGDRGELADILRTLCRHPFAISLLGQLQQVDLDASRERLNSLDLLISLRFSDSDEPPGDAAAFLEERDNPKHVTNSASLEVARCCEQIRAIGGSLSHRRQPDGASLLVITLPFEKFRES